MRFEREFDDAMWGWRRWESYRDKRRERAKRAKPIIDKNDPYIILGIARRATKLEIKRAFRELAKKHHPDVGGNPEMFKKIKAAFDMVYARALG